MPALINPWLLPLLTAIGLPVLIHLLTRPRPRRIRYPTWRLLMDAGSGRQALDRLRTILLLVLRGLFVFGLVATFLRPELVPTRGAAAPGEARRVVLVVDASLSMRATTAGSPLFTRARAQAAEVLRRLEPGTLAGVVFMGARPRAVLPALTTNLASLHEVLSQSAATCERGDADAAVEEAVHLLDGAGSVYVFSDLQRTNWGTVDFTRHSQVAFYLPRLIERPVDNAGIVAVECSPVRPVAGEPVEITCRIFNASPTRREEELRLDVAGLTESERLELAPYSHGELRFTLTLPPSGVVAAGEARLRGDDLPDDDRRLFPLAVRPALKVLTISDADQNDPTTAAFFICAALAPVANGGIDLDHRLSQGVDRGVLETADAFVLIPPVSLVGDTGAVIARRVLEGAMLLCLLDGPSAPATLAVLQSASNGQITPPFDLTDTVHTTIAAGHLVPPDFLPPALGLFHGEGGGDLATLAVLRHFRTDDRTARADEVLLRHADGATALTLGRANRGAVVFLNCPAAPDAGNLPGNPLFACLLHEMLKAMRSGDDSDAATPGRPWTLEVTATDGTPVVTGPDGTSVESTVLSRGRSLRLSLPPPRDPGIYRVMVGDRELGLGVVNVDPKETDTRPLEVELLAREAPAGAVNLIDRHGDLVQAGRPRELWPELLALAAAALAGEMVILAFWRKRRPTVITPLMAPHPEGLR